MKRVPSSESLPAVRYARVSSEEQEKEGYSIPAQTKFLNGCATKEGIRILREFIDMETAKQPGRPGFMAMVDFFAKEAKKDPLQRCRTLLVEKTDRLYAKATSRRSSSIGKPLSVSRLSTIVCNGASRSRTRISSTSGSPRSSMIGGLKHSLPAQAPSCEHRQIFRRLV